MNSALGYHHAQMVSIINDYVCLFLSQVFPLQYELVCNVTLDKCGFRTLSDMKANHMFQSNDIYGIILAKVIRFN